MLRRFHFNSFVGPSFLLLTGESVFQEKYNTFSKIPPASPGNQKDKGALEKLKLLLLYIFTKDKANNVNTRQILVGRRYSCFYILLLLLEVASGMVSLLLLRYKKWKYKNSGGGVWFIFTLKPINPPKSEQADPLTEQAMSNLILRIIVEKNIQGQNLQY